jgi:diadenosine tetraphosphate (Ap4A) HIT family hydrolase
VAHLHWHVIARFDWDSHFPASVWSAPQRPADFAAVAAIAARLEDVDGAIERALSV